MSSKVESFTFNRHVSSLVTVVAFVAACLSSPAAHAVDDDWLRFKADVEERTREERVEGIAYMVSGGLVLIGSAIGYENSRDPIAKTVYSISQSLSIGAIGFGSHLYSVGGADRDFLNIIENSTSLSLAQKNEILRSYRARKEHNEKSQKWIRVATHGLIAAVNLYNAGRETDEGLRTALYFVGGVNAIAAISISF